MKKEITAQEWELIEALRNYSKSRHNPSLGLELWIDELVDNLKERN